MKNQTPAQNQNAPSTQFVTSRTVKFLFVKLQARYGARFTGQYPDDLWPAAQQEWFEQLQYLRCEDIKRGLHVWRNDWPPNVIEFAKACEPPKLSGCQQILRDQARKELPAPRVSPQKTAENIAKLKSEIHGAELFSEDKS